jgi:peptide/nickel transport system substrate-binding protein
MTVPTRLGRRLSTLMLALALIGGTATSVAVAQEPQAGGVLTLAWTSELPTIDPHWTTAAVTADVVVHIFETLFALDESGAPVPFLVADYTISDDELVYTFELREGIPFHDGSIMTSEDVVASLQRWGEVTASGRTMFQRVESLTATGEHEVEIVLNEPYGPLLTSIANPYRSIPGIMPASVVEAAGDDQVSTFIGTGPYQFAEHVPDVHLRLTRFEDYAARDDEPSGYAGRRVAYIDELRFVPVPEMTTRVAGIEAGQFDFADDISGDLFRIVDANPRLQTFPQHVGLTYIQFNKRDGLFTDVRMRQAFLAALDMAPINQVAFGEEDFYRLSPSLMPEGVWYSDAGADQFDQADPERARALLEEAGYAGEPVRWLVPQDREFMYNAAIAALPQLEAAGFNIDMQITDWPTLVERRGTSEVWDAFSGGVVNAAEPTDDVYFSAEWFGWWVDDYKEDLLNQLYVTADQDERFALWEEFQRYWWEQVPGISLGHRSQLRVATLDMQGYGAVNTPLFWNVWLDR